MNTIEHFEQIYLHDSGVMHINLHVQKSTCRILLDRAGLLRDPPAPFDYERYYKPAVLEFTDVKILKMPEGYCLNDVIAEHEIQASDFPGYYRFTLAMMGGWDNDTFMRTIEIVAKDFSLSGEVSTPPQAG
jgi:hypothetical protein